MKILTHTLYIVLILIGLSSCEMREEILGHTDKVETGSLELTVDAKSPHETKAGISTADFPVTIVSMANENYEVAKQFPAVSEMPQSVLLPVGKYYVLSHSKGDIVKRMEAPYYKGGTNLDILKDVVSKADVVCRMLNSRIEIKYSAEFIAKFTSWNITLNDGSETALSIKNTDATKPIYWFFGEKGAETVTLHIRATTTEGNTILMPPYVFRKTDAGYADINNPNFVGGDALIINLKPGKESDPTSGKVTDISVTLNVLFENHDELVEIPVEDKVEEPDVPVVPDQPQGNGPEVIMPADFSYSLSGNPSKPASADVMMKVPEGMKSAKVKIVTDNPDFETTLADAAFDEPGALLVGADLIGNNGIQGLFTALDLKDEQNYPKKTPEIGATEYIFPVSAFFTFLDIFTGKHEFHIILEDQNGGKTEKVLTITITE